MSAIIMGVDPGIGMCGYGFLDAATGQPVDTPFGAYGVIQTKKEKGGKENPIPARLAELEADVSAILASVKPAILAIEVFIPNPRLAFNAPMVLQARGVVLLLAQKAGCAIFEYRPNVVKQTVTGKGNAVKHEVQEAMQEAMGLEVLPRPDDAADALALAYTHHLHVGGGLVA